MNPIQGLAFDREAALTKEFIANGELETGFTKAVAQGGVSANSTHSRLHEKRKKLNVLMPTEGNARYK
jgi:hypothetical protein